MNRTRSANRVIGRAPRIKCTKAIRAAIEGFIEGLAGRYNNGITMTIVLLVVLRLRVSEFVMPKAIVALVY